MYIYGKIFSVLVQRVTILHRRRWPLYWEGHVFPERYRRPSTFNSANEKSHCQLFESAIRFEKYLFLQKFQRETKTDGERCATTSEISSSSACRRSYAYTYTHSYAHLYAHTHPHMHTHKHVHVRAHIYTLGCNCQTLLRW